MKPVFLGVLGLIGSAAAVLQTGVGGGRFIS